MYRRFIATILAAGLAISGLNASPALASDRDTARLLAGVAAVAILGAAIAHSNKRKHDGVSRGHGYAPVYHGGHHRRHHGAHSGHRKPHGHSRHHGHDRGPKRHHDGYARAGHHPLPGACRVRSGHRSGYSGRCLQRHYSGYHALPYQCEVHIGGRHGTVYRDRCLARYGY